MDPQVIQVFAAVAGEKDPIKKQALKDRSNAALSAHFAHPRNIADLHELAYDITTMVWADAGNQDVLNKIIEVKTVDFSAVDFVDEDLRGQRAYWMGAGGQIRSDILRSERHYIERDQIVTAVDIHLNDLKTNFWGTFEKLKSQATAKVQDAPLERLIELIKMGVVNSPTYSEINLSTMTDVEIDAVINPVASRSKGGVTLLGTENAVSLLSNVGLDFGDNLKEQIFNTGQIGVYKGRPVVKVENYEDFAGKLVLPENEIWVIGQNAGRLTWYGSTPDSQVLNSSGFWQRWELKRDAGLTVWGIPKGRIGRIVIK